MARDMWVTRNPWWIQTWRNASTRDIKTLFCATYKIFRESISRRGDYGNLTSAPLTNYPLKDENAAKKAYIFWPKLKEVVIFQKSIPKSKQPNRDQVGESKSFVTLFVKQNDPLLPVKLFFFKHNDAFFNGLFRKYCPRFSSQVYFARCFKDPAPPS